MALREMKTVGRFLTNAPRIVGLVQVIQKAAIVVIVLMLLGHLVIAIRDTINKEMLV